MKLIVGLGNPGKKYEQTRHNMGFMTVEHFIKDIEPVKDTVWENSEKFKSDIFQLDFPQGKKIEKIILAKPKTYMNNSGMVVKLISDFYKIASDDVWVVYDEFDLPFGQMKIRFGGASAGHHGIDSIIEHLGTDKFWRFRLGIGLSKESGAEGKEHTISKHNHKNVDDFVLDKFTGGQWGKARELIKRGSKALFSALDEGLESAKNKYNTK